MTDKTPEYSVEVFEAVKSYGGQTILDHVDLAVPTGSITAILGASGSGKTTLLRLIAGFDRLDSGRIIVGGRIVDDGRHTVHAQRRGIGFVPQDGGLFPHMTAAANIGFGLARRDRGRVEELLDLVGLEGLGRRRPHQLSGGQQQRVALARALAIEPRILLLDEPFASLDAALRASMRRDLARILTAAQTTTILVTHDRDEALSMADQLAVLADGHLLAAGSPREVYRTPGNVEAAVLSGEANLLTPSDLAPAAARALAIDVSASATALLRPEQIVVETSPSASSVTAEVVSTEFRGAETVAYVRLSGQAENLLTARLAGDAVIAVGQQVWVRAASSPHLIGGGRMSSL